EMLFKDLCLTRRGKAATWRKAREDVYGGSFLHFKRAFFVNKLDTQGFRLYRPVKVVNEKKQRANLLFFRRPVIIDTVDSMVVYIGSRKRVDYRVVDSTDYYKHVLKEPDSLTDTRLITG